MSVVADSGRVYEGSTMTVSHIRLLGLVVALGLVLVLPAGAERGPTFRLIDAVGDARGAAADIASIDIWNDADTITFELKFANRTTLTPDDLVGVFIDTDSNLDTGGDGAEYAVFFGDSWQGFFRWNGADWQETASTLARPGSLSISLNRSDLGGVKLLGVSPYTALASDDVSWDDTGYGPFAFLVPAKLVGASLTVSPARAALPVGTRVTARVAVRLDDGTTARPTAATCRMTLAGRTVRPVAPCSWKLPAAAKGKRVVVTARGTYRGTAFSTRQAAINVR